jgi:glycosyltransferase involved in cell wall biosynthesis
MRQESNSQRPRVSVILIFLDKAPFLQEAIESVISQTFEMWELLLVDDGSTDGSTDIAKMAARRLPHTIHYLEHEGHANRGMSTSRNVGLHHAQGEYMLFMDGDDVLTHNVLREQVALMEAHPVGTVYGSLYPGLIGMNDLTSTVETSFRILIWELTLPQKDTLRQSVPHGADSSDGRVRVLV